MKRFYISLFFCVIISFGTCQTYEIGVTAFVSTCSGTFCDNGGETGNYTNNFNDTITFCSDAGGVATANFTATNIATGDYLFVYFGDEAGGVPDMTNPSTGLIISTCPFITFVFVSDAGGVAGGWAATIGCTAPSVVANDNPVYAKVPSLDGTVLLNETTIGATADIASGCFSAGNSVWYWFSLSGGNNTISVTVESAGFSNVQSLLMHGYNCSDGSASVVGTQCFAAGNAIQWTNLTQGYYWLGIASAVSGNFNISFKESYQDYCGDFFCGPGESCLTCPFDCGICPEAEGGPYYHPITGMQSTKLGQCLVSTNTGSYYDNGGPGLTYAANVDNIFRTFCPSSPLNTIQATVKSLQIEYSGMLCKDQLIVRNGPSQNSTILWSGCGNSSIPSIRTTNGAYNSGVFSSTHQSGCLTFAFQSDASNSGFWDGWEITLKEIAYPSGPAGTYNNDCERAIALCDDFTVSSQMYGPGLSSESCASCILTESFSEWYKIKVSSGGVMEFEITPLGNSDMDFAIFKADSCGDIGSPIRCSHAVYQPPGKTGLSVLAGDISEDVNGDQWVSELNIKANESYYILINECNKQNPNSYTLDFMLSGGASFDCSIVLPVAFLDFSASIRNKGVELTWKTASETNNDYFTVERSVDGENYIPLEYIDGNGNSNEMIHYYYLDDHPVQGLAYYRIRQTDFDGKYDFSKVLPVDYSDRKLPWVNIYPSPATDFIHVSIDESSVDKEYIIFNAIGIEVESGLCNKEEFNLSVSDLDDGVYYFSLNGSQQIPFIVSR